MKKALQVSLFFGFILLAGCYGKFTQTSIPESETATDASYQSQYQLVKSLNQPIIGYKAGLTSKAGQAKFKVSEPVAGALFEAGLSHNRQVYLLTDYHKLMLETEIGFILKQDLNHPILRPEQLVKLIEKVVPVIELPNLDYPDLNTLTGLKLISSNVAANQVLIGEGVSLDKIELSLIETRLSRNGQVVIEGKATDAMGDQLTALQWLINRSLAIGYQLKKGDLLITGALGKMIPAERGQYDADFGNLGKLSFAIR